MKRKLGIILLIFALTFSFMIDVNAETKIKEDANTYVGDVYIIGSSKFDSNIIITGTMASVAGAREAYVQYAVNGNYKFKPEDVKIYYYSELAESWSVLPATSGEQIKELTQEETKKLTENLNIYYVNEEEKILEVPYEVRVEEGYELQFVTNDENNDAKVKYESGKLILPATVKWVDVYATSEPKVEDDEPEELYLGMIEQTEGTFETISRVVRTYEELTLAIAEGIEYIQIEEDIDLPTALEITTKVDIYLNDANLTVTKDTAGDGVFHVLEGGDLTINGEGKIDGTGNNKWNIVIFAEAGKVTLNGGTYTNKNAVIQEDNIDANHFDVIYAKGEAEVIINGGTFEGKTPTWLLNIHDGSRETASITVNGGTFIGFNPANNKAEGEGTNFLAEGYKVKPYNGEYIVLPISKSDVALVDYVGYTSLQEAVNYTADGSTVEIIADIDSPTAVEVSRKATVELNGHNLTVTKDTAGDGVFHVVEGGDLTINGEGKIDGTGNNKWNIVIFAEAGKVTLNGGTYTNKNAVIQEDDIDANHFDVIYAKGDAEVIINGGTFEGKTPTWLLNIHDGSRETASITVNGGTFIGFNPANNKAEGEGTNFLTEGYKVSLEDDKYTVIETAEDDAALVNGFAYTNLNDAVTNAPAGSTVEIIADIDSPTAVEVSKKVTVELNGHNLTVTKDTAGDGVFHVVEGGDLTINGEGKIDGTGNNKWNIVIFAEAGKVTLNGGTYTNKKVVVQENDTDENHFDVIYAKGEAEVIINGGTFEGKTPTWLLNIHDGSRETASITVNGGTFIGFNPANNKAEGEGTNFLAGGYKVSLEDDKYTVIETAEDEVATINGVAYKDLQEALNDASNGETVMLAKNIIYNDCLSVPLKYSATTENRSAVLDLNGKKLTATLSNTKNISVINVVGTTGTATLTIEDSSKDMSGTLLAKPMIDSDGWDVAIAAISVEANGRLIVNSGNIIINAGDVEATNPYGIDVRTNGSDKTAELTVNGGYIESKTSTGMGVRLFANSEKAPIKFTMNGGTIVGAENDRGVWLHNAGGSVPKYNLIEVVINGGKIIADRALEVADFNKQTDVAENIKITINGGEFVSTNLRNNDTHPECADLTTGMSEEYYNTVFSHVKLIDNRKKVSA